MSRSDQSSATTRTVGAADGASTDDRVGLRMRVHVDLDRCKGHNRCYAIAPDLFDVDDLGFAHEVGDGSVPHELEEQARLAAANCPEFAIEITEDA
jgi:ferredoxin